MERIVCKECGLSEVVYNVVGEDLWSAETHNCIKKQDTEEGVEYYICNECYKTVDINDISMMLTFDL